MAKKLQPSDEYSPIFNRLIISCDAYGITPSNLCDEFTTSRSALTAWKKGNINVDIIEPICKRINVSVEFLITGKESIDSELTPDEIQLIANYRTLSEQGKGYITETMIMAKDRFKKEQSVHQSVEQVG